MTKINLCVCDCCKNVILDPYKVKVREFYYSKEHKPFIGCIVRRDTRKKVTLCGECYEKIANCSNDIKSL